MGHDVMVNDGGFCFLSRIFFRYVVVKHGGEGDGAAW